MRASALVYGIVRNTYQKFQLTTADDYSHDFQEERCKTRSCRENVPLDEDIRPLNVKPNRLTAAPDMLSVNTEDKPVEPYEVLKCNRKVNVFDGDAFTIRSPGYPEPAQENETYVQFDPSGWYLGLVDIVILIWDVPLSCLDGRNLSNDLMCSIICSCISSCHSSHFSSIRLQVLLVFPSPAESRC